MVAIASETTTVCQSGLNAGREWNDHPPDTIDAPIVNLGFGSLPSAMTIIAIIAAALAMSISDAERPPKNHMATSDPTAIEFCNGL